MCSNKPRGKTVPITRQPGEWHWWGPGPPGGKQTGRFARGFAAMCGSRGDMIEIDPNRGHPAGMWPPPSEEGRWTGKAWFHLTWPFRLSLHEPTCRWRRFALTFTRQGPP